MIYKNSYLKKELRQSYTGTKTGANRKTAFAFFLGLLSFALYFILQTLKESVLSDVVPEIMQPSFFSTLYIYIHLSFLLNTLYFIIYYDYLFFSEIKKNSWYLLVQMGHNPITMIFTKLFALLYSVIWIYSIGFFLVTILTFFLKYNFISAYIPTLYIAGLIDLILISLFAMMVSLHTKTLINTRYLVFFSAVLIIAIKIKLKFYTVLSNRVAMQDIYTLFDPSRSGFLPVVGVIIAASCLACILSARNAAKYYTLPAYDYDLPEDVIAVQKESKTGIWGPVHQRKNTGRQRKIFDTVVTVILIIFIFTALIFNVLVILINSATPGSEVTIRGIIPYIFKSKTMEPDIMLNDLAYFRKIDNRYKINVDQIIIFKQDHVIFVERVIEKNIDGLKVDIDNYPLTAQPGAMVKTIPRETVIGVFTGRNRWLGALILFANTVFGRLLFLLLPTVLLFYYRQIYDFYKRNNK